eukprot:g1888.t1
MLRPLINAAQNLVVIMMFSVDWPESVKVFQQIISGINFNFVQVASPTCLGIPVNFYGRFVSTVVLSGAVIGVPWLVSCLRHRRNNPAKWAGAIKGRLRDTFLLVVLLHPSVSGQSFYHFRCRSVNNTWYLMADMSLECYDTMWFGMLVPVVMTILGFAIGMPLLFVRLLWVRRKELENPETKRLLGVLYMSYKPGLYWFESVTMLFKLALWATLVYFEHGSQFQLATSVVVCWIQLAVHARLEPFNDLFKNMVQYVSLILVTFASFSGLVLNYLEVSVELARLTFREAEGRRFASQEATFKIITAVVIWFGAVIIMLQPTYYGEVRSSAAFTSDSKITFIGNNEFRLLAINVLDGTEKWEFRANGDIMSSPVVSGDDKTVFVGSRDFHLYALNTIDGTQKWNFSTGGTFSGIFSSPALSTDDKTVFFGAEDKKLYAVHAEDGSLRWAFTTGDKVSSSPTLSADGKLAFVGSDDGKIYSVNTADGSKNWEFNTGDKVVSSPAVSGDGAVVFVGSDSKSLFAVNAADGSLKWQYLTGGWVKSSPIVGADDKTVFFGSFDNKLYAINAADGTKKWEFLTGDSVYSSPAFSADAAMIFIASTDSNIYAIGTADGKKRWTFATGARVYSSPTLSPDGATVIVGSDDRKVYALATPDCVTCPDGWYLNRTVASVCIKCDPDMESVYGDGNATSATSTTA